MATYAVPTTDEALSYGIRAAKRKDLPNARAALSWVLKREPANVVAWLWMAECAPSDGQRYQCMSQVASLDPFAQAN
jgi:hypothetical protein